MASRAKITFFPKADTTGYCLDKLKIIDKASCWTYDTTDFINNGYVYTDTETSISTVNSNYWIQFKAVSGYKITDCHKTNSAGTSNTGDFEILEDNTVIVYPWNNGTASIVNNYLYVAVDVDTSNKHEVTHNLTNCTCDCLSEYADGEAVTISLLADDGCLFDDVPVATMDGVTYPFTLSDDKSGATLGITVTSDIVITGSATSYYKVMTDLTNCTCDTTVVKSGKQTIVISADTGYELNSNIVLYDSYTKITSVYSDFTDDNTKCTITHDMQGDIRVTGVAVKKSEKLSSFSNLYRVTNSVLTDLSKVRFYETSGESVTTVDYGSFITNLYRLPFELDDNMIGDTGNIQLGNYDSRVATDILLNYVYIVSMGTITIPEKYNNIYDYKDTVCRLYLPYCNTIDIPTHYVMNCTLNIVYKVDLYSGKCTVNVYSSFTNEVVASETFTIGAKIPFMQEQNNSIVNNLDNILDNDVFTPFIEVVRSVPYHVETLFGAETVDFGTLENYKGYLKVSDVALNINAPNEDKSEIEMLLKNGVFINEKVVDFSNNI